MSYTVATPGGKVRPATVTVASYLLYLCAAIQVINLVLSASALSPTIEAYKEVYAGEANADALTTTAQLGGIGGIIVAALFAIATGVLGMLIGKGKNPARIVTWVLASIGVLCFGCLLALGSVASSMNGGTTGDPQADALQRRLEDAIPAWQNAVSTILSVIMLLALVAVIILLALPASNEFFRKEQEVWAPPTAPDLTPFPSPAPFPPAPLSVPQQTAPPSAAVAPPAPTVAPEPPVAPPAAPPSDPSAPTPPSAPQS